MISLVDRFGSSRRPHRARALPKRKRPQPELAGRDSAHKGGGKKRPKLTQQCILVSIIVVILQKTQAGRW